MKLPSPRVKNVSPVAARKALVSGRAKIRAWSASIALTPRCNRSASCSGVCSFSGLADERDSCGENSATSFSDGELSSKRHGMPNR
jgi:hypothetical protein